MLACQSALTDRLVFQLSLEAVEMEELEMKTMATQQSVLDKDQNIKNPREIRSALEQLRIALIDPINISLWRRSDVPRGRLLYNVEQALSALCGSNHAFHKLCLLISVLHEEKARALRSDASGILSTTVNNLTRHLFGNGLQLST